MIDILMKWYTCTGSRCHSSNQLQKGPIPQVFQGNFPSNRSHLLSGALSTHLGTLFFTSLISFRRLMLDAFKAWRQYPLLMKKERERGKEEPATKESSRNSSWLSNMTEETERRLGKQTKGPILFSVIFLPDETNSWWSSVQCKW